MKRRPDRLRISSIARGRTTTLPLRQRGLSGDAQSRTFRGEAAAERITRHLRPETVTLYATKPPPRLLLDYKLRPDPLGPVEIVERFWAFDTEDAAVVPLPLIYADLVMTGDARGLETADLIYERIVDGFVG